MRPLILLGALVSQLGAQVPDAPRAAKVLELLRRLPTAHVHLHATPLVLATNAYGCEIVVPSLSGLCGTGWRPAFDPALARRLARDLAAIYGLRTDADAKAPGAVAARLDAFDGARGVGLKLRGTVASKAVAEGMDWPTVADEPADTDVDVDEHAALSQQGLRVHVADVEAFWTAHSQDTFTTTLAYLASVAAFLNRVTDGEDVDLSAVIGARSMWIPVTPPKGRAGLRVLPFGGGAVLETTQALEVAITVDPRTADVASGPLAKDPRTRFQAPRTRAPAPLSNGGRPTVVWISGLQAESGTCRASLRQKGRDGRERELAASAHELVFAPGEFDAAQPFAIVLSLQPGRYRLHDFVWVGAPEH
jgi:hypothetical protein